MSSREPEPARHVGRLVDPSVLGDGELEPSFEPGAPFPEETVEGSSVSHSPPGAARGDDEPIPRENTGDTGEPDSAERNALPSFADDLAASSPEPASTEADSGRLANAPSPFDGVSPSPALQAGAEDAPAPPPQRHTAAPPIAVSPISRPETEESRPIGMSQSEHSRRLELERMASEPLPRRTAGTSHRPGRGSLSPNLVALFGALLGITTIAALIAIAMQLDHGERTYATPTASGTAPASAATQGAPPASPPEVEATRPPPKKSRPKLPGPYRVRDGRDDPAMRFVEGRVGFEPFLKAVEKSGVPLKEAYRLLIAFQKVHPLTNCSKNDRFAALIDRKTRKLKAFEYIVSPEEVFQAREGSDGLLKASKLDLMVKRERISGSLVVGSKGLSAAIEEQGFEPALTKVLGEALSGHHSLGELEPGTRLRLVGQEVTTLGEFIRYAGLETLEVNFPGKNEPERFYFFGSPGNRGYFDQNGRAPYEGGWRVPIPGAPVTSKFNLRRMHPVLHKIKPHTGMDFGAAMGVPVGACSFGVIKFIGNGGPCGNMVRIEHTDGIETGYCHLSRFGEELKVGDKVTRLQTIGYVGSTGRSTGPHLHFFAKRKGEFIDPESLKLDALRVLPASERGAFQQLRSRYDAELDAITLPPAPATTAGSAADDAPVPSGVAEGEEETDATEPAMGEPQAALSASGATTKVAPDAPAASAPAPQQKPSGSSIYLTDEELLKSQGRDDSGEVP